MYGVNNYFCQASFLVLIAVLVIFLLIALYNYTNPYYQKSEVQLIDVLKELIPRNPDLITNNEERLKKYAPEKKTLNPFFPFRLNYTFLIIYGEDKVNDVSLFRFVDSFTSNKSLYKINTDTGVITQTNENKENGEAKEVKKITSLPQEGLMTDDGGAVFIFDNSLYTNVRHGHPELSIPNLL